VNLAALYQVATPLKLNILNLLTIPPFLAKLDIRRVYSDHKDRLSLFKHHKVKHEMTFIVNEYTHAILSPNAK
jgi:hypothetical protein